MKIEHRPLGGYVERGCGLEGAAPRKLKSHRDAEEHGIRRKASRTTRAMMVHANELERKPPLVRVHEFSSAFFVSGRELKLVIVCLISDLPFFDLPAPCSPLAKVLKDRGNNRSRLRLAANLRSLSRENLTTS